VLKSRDAEGMEKNFLLKSGCGHGTWDKHFSLLGGWIQRMGYLSQEIRSEGWAVVDQAAHFWDWGKKMMKLVKAWKKSSRRKSKVETGIILD
jgi:hypothetical protein